MENKAKLKHVVLELQLTCFDYIPGCKSVSKVIQAVDM